MPAFYIRFLPEGRIETFAGSRGNYYELEDGAHVDLLSEPVWCHCCGKISHGEQLQTLRQIDGELAKTERLAAEIRRDLHVGHCEPDAPGDAHQQERIAALRLRRRWRAARISPPRCIICGSTDIVRLAGSAPVHHPRGSGTITVECIGMCSTRFNEWFFTPEGERILRETTPTYWRFQLRPH